MKEGERVLMVGDGTNDAPALSSATVGVALASGGGGITAEAADAVLLADDPIRLAEAIAISRRTLRLARQSIWAGLGLSGLAMIAAALGYIPPIAGALLQEAIDVAVIINALRATFEGATIVETARRESRRAGRGQRQPGERLAVERHEGRAEGCGVACHGFLPAWSGVGGAGIEDPESELGGGPLDLREPGSQPLQQRRYAVGKFLRRSPAAPDTIRLQPEVQDAIATSDESCRDVLGEHRPEPMHQHELRGVAVPEIVGQTPDRGPSRPEVGT